MESASSSKNNFGSQIPERRKFIVRFDFGKVFYFPKILEFNELSWTAARTLTSIWQTVIEFDMDGNFHGSNEFGRLQKHLWAISLHVLNPTWTFPTVFCIGTKICGDSVSHINCFFETPYGRQHPYCRSKWNSSCTQKTFIRSQMEVAETVCRQTSFTCKRQNRWNQPPDVSI